MRKQLQISLQMQHKSSAIRYTSWLLGEVQELKTSAKQNGIMRQHFSSNIFYTGYQDLVLLSVISFVIIKPDFKAFGLTAPVLVIYKMNCFIY